MSKPVIQGFGQRPNIITQGFGIGAFATIGGGVIDLDSGGVLPVPSPVRSDNTIVIVQGRDYLDDDMNALRWSIADYTDDQGNQLLGPDVDDLTVTLYVMAKSDYDAGSGSTVLTATGSAAMDTTVETTAVLQVDLTAAQTATLDSAPASERFAYIYELVAETGDGHVIHQVLNSLYCRRSGEV